MPVVDPEGDIQEFMHKKLTTPLTHIAMLGENSLNVSMLFFFFTKIIF